MTGVGVFAIPAVSIRAGVVRTDLKVFFIFTELEEMMQL